MKRHKQWGWLAIFNLVPLGINFWNAWNGSPVWLFFLVLAALVSGAATTMWWLTR